MVYLGLTNQFKTTVVLRGIDGDLMVSSEDLIELYTRRNNPSSVPRRKKRNTYEVLCLFDRDQTYSLRYLNTGDFVEIRGNVVSNSLGKYNNILYGLDIAKCVLKNHRPNSEDIDDASISTD